MDLGQAGDFSSPPQQGQRPGRHHARSVPFVELRFDLFALLLDLVPQYPYGDRCCSKFR
jgi:hypothetical protein